MESPSTMDMTDIKLDCMEEDVLVEREAEDSEADIQVIVDVKMLLSTACLMKDSLLSQRIHQKKSNILHPSLKLICSEAVDISDIQDQIQQLISISSDTEDKTARNTAAGKEDEIDSVMDNKQINFVNESENITLHGPIHQVNALTQTAEELTLKLLNEEYLIAAAGQAKQSSASSQQHQQRIPTLDLVLSQTQSTNSYLDLASHLDRCLQLKDQSTSFAQSASHVRSCAVANGHKDLLKKWKGRLEKRTALQTVPW
jgi:hypothetical protein